ncbi:hypothetical protein HMN09_00920000 [Mycena chlorophos]|uniref:Uncharacterized protein n=1 Tax=Mycena chlorophos TaxID=658473 RepID=A0A8H6SK72_MYCCL|nr:hypothetical protein HMN09_00920000 [Mycena chlorophos]
MTRRIVVDDADDSIHYASNGWYIANPQALNALGNFGPVYKNTSHGTTTNGSTLSFGFSGTTVEVTGTIAVQKLADGSYDPTWVCTVDGSPIPNPNPTFAYPENNWSLCSASSLSPSSPHTLEITVHTRGTAFYVDNIFYTPTVDPTALAGAVLEVLNTDSSVSFGTGWEGWGAQNVTRMAGSEVTLSFRGTAMSLIGYVPEELPRNATTARYSIDGGAPTTIRLAGLAAGSTTTMYNVVILQVDSLSPDNHTLVVTYDGSNATTPLPVGAFYVTNSATTSSGSTTTGSGNPSSPSSQPISSSTAASLSASSTKSPKAAIAGGTIASIVAIALLALLFFWARRKRRDIRENMVGTRPQPFMEMRSDADGAAILATGGTRPASLSAQATSGSSSQGHGHSLSSDSIEGRQGMAPSQQWAREQLGEDGAAMGYGFRYPGHGAQAEYSENNPANPFSNPIAAPSSEALAPLSPNRRRNLSPTNRAGSEEGSSGDATATELAYARSSVARSDLVGQRGDGGGRTVVDVPPSYSRE